MRQMITLKEALDFMNTGHPFDITFKTANRDKKTGGKTIVMKHAVRTEGGNEMTPHANKLTSHTNKMPSEGNRDANHYEHRTRNITVMGTQQIRKVHNRLITRFNGKKIIWGK